MFLEDQLYQNRILKQSNSQVYNPLLPKTDIKTLLHRVDEDNHSEDQGIEDYKIGGYHPVHIGEVLANRYVVIQKLGWGHFSTVWLCRDFKFATYVAVKIQKSSPRYMDAAFDQVQILQRVQLKCSDQQWRGRSRDDTHVVGLLNAFLHRSVYGNHFCMVFEILRCNLLDVIKGYNYQGLPLNLCQEIARQVLQGLDFLHRVCGVIHTDLKPENVMLCLTKEELIELVETGQLNDKELFETRLQLFRQGMGHQSGEDEQKSQQTATSKIATIEEKLKKEALSKTQKKNLKKKLRKQKLKVQDKGEVQNTPRAEVRTLNELLGLRKGGLDMRCPKQLKLPLRIKIADLGNACWKHHHFSTQIQTRQYRSPEVILGQSYTETSDMWSLACMLYELLTGDLLFQPKKTQEWSKNQDHLAQIQELLGPFHPHFVARSPKATKYFARDGLMKRFPHLSHYSLATVLKLKNRIKPAEATKFAEFLLPMLVPEPQNRISAASALQLPWLAIPHFEHPTKISEQEHKQLKQQFQQNQSKFQQRVHIEHCSQPSYQNEPYPLPSRSKPKQRFCDIRTIDRSFTDLGYIGFCDGIDLGKLDNCRNWQFK